MAAVVGWPIRAMVVTPASEGPGPTWEPTGPPIGIMGKGGAGDWEGAMSREGDPGVDTNGPRPPCRPNAELLGGPPMPRPARPELRLASGSTGCEGKGVKPVWPRITPGGWRGLLISKLQFVAIAKIVSDSSWDTPPLLKYNLALTFIFYFESRFYYLHPA